MDRDVAGALRSIGVGKENIDFWTYLVG